MSVAWVAEEVHPHH